MNPKCMILKSAENEHYLMGETGHSIMLLPKRFLKEFNGNKDIQVQQQLGTCDPPQKMLDLTTYL